MIFLRKDTLYAKRKDKQAEAKKGGKKGHKGRWKCFFSGNKAPHLYNCVSTVMNQDAINRIPAAILNS
jgi:hypothetical protein